ncbi:MAG: AsnC family transcriptional regulator [Dehalococcoidia bacterium]|nr:AsnC family transcriptional regulator [Dehalococcoidia bacterium]
MIDNIDKRIILELQEDGRSSYKAIAKKLGLSTPTVFRRVQRLIKERVVKITAIPDPYKIGHLTVASIGITADLKKIDGLVKKLSIFPDIHLMAFTYGRYDIVCWVQTTSAENLNILVRKIGKLEAVKTMETIIWSQLTKRTYGWLSQSEVE